MIEQGPFVTADGIHLDPMDLPQLFVVVPRPYVPGVVPTAESLPMLARLDMQGAPVYYDGPAKTWRVWNRPAGELYFDPLNAIDARTKSIQHIANLARIVANEWLNLSVMTIPAAGDEAWPVVK